LDFDHALSKFSSRGCPTLEEMKGRIEKARGYSARKVIQSAIRCPSAVPSGSPPPEQLIAAAAAAVATASSEE
jgi:hypothetical protein